MESTNIMLSIKKKNLKEIISFAPIPSDPEMKREERFCQISNLVHSGM